MKTNVAHAFTMRNIKQRKKEIVRRTEETSQECQCLSQNVVCIKKRTNGKAKVQKAKEKQRNITKG